MKVALVLLAAAGVVGYIYRKEIVTEIQKKVQLVVTDLDQDPAFLRDIFKGRLPEDEA